MAARASSETSTTNSQLDASSSKSPHIHFPIDADRPAPSSARVSPARHHSPLNPHSISEPSRRRVRSAASSGEAFRGPPLGKKYVNSFATPPRRPIPSGTRDSEQVGEDSLGLRLFSDEYDLAREDPRILQDVQRALKLKARREARLSQSPASPRSDVAESYRLQPATPMLPFFAQTSATNQNDSLTSEIDFGPSTSAPLLHPVPTSLNNGLTLDWSSFDDKAESRWKLTGPKRKGKEPLPPLAVTVNQLAAAYSDKIAGIRVSATLHTLKKADMTKDQLGRRYAALYSSLSSRMPFNMAKAVHWYNELTVHDREALEAAEPSTWLKHLDRHRSKSSERSPWHLTALVVEESVRPKHTYNPNLADYASRPLSETSPSDSPTSPFSHTRHAPFASPASSNYLFRQSSRKTDSAEDGLTFEPIVHSTRTSLEIDSRRSHDSSFSSLPLGPSPITHHPPNKQLQSIKVSMPVPKMPLNDTVSEEQPSSDDPRRQGREFTSANGPNIRIVPFIDGADSNISAGVGITVHLTAPTPSDAESPPAQEEQLRKQQPKPYIDRSLKPRRTHASLPLDDHSLLGSSEIRHRREVDERAYEHKEKLLSQMVRHNHRIRQLLNRVSSDVREYESIQSQTMSSLGIEYDGLPRELVDAFGHDPASFTGPTRRFRGWRAVDDIQHRLLRQREVLQNFLSRANDGDASVPRSVLDDPISSLTRLLETLEMESEKIAGRAIEVSEALKTVQGTHSIAKAMYNDTLTRTSAVYPELSYIIALEESYKDQYQQFWEFGMDTLTFILDTVTPFWRNYGKPIGDDIRDFLIIPLYRNEFTGEAKRYPIPRIPRRSFRHWFGLLMFFLTSTAIVILQARTAVSSTVYYKLPMISYDSVRWAALPFFWISIMIQWWAVVVEAIIVLVQLAVLVWWAGWSVRIFS